MTRHFTRHVAVLECKGLYFKLALCYYITAELQFL